MKMTIVNISFLGIWILFGYYVPMGSLLLTMFMLPFVLSTTFLMFRNVAPFISIAFSFFIILIHDYLFRKFGGGQHDNAGKALSDISFYATLFITIIAMIFAKLNFSKKVLGVQSIFKVGILQLFKDIGLIVAYGLIAYICFKYFNNF